jgi:predicted nucleic acid-binding protein
LKSQVVIDSSTALKWVVSEADSESALLLRDHYSFIAPELLIAECANAVWKRVRRGEMTNEAAQIAVKLLQSDDLALVPLSILTSSALQLALTLEHPVYDCLFIALAVREACPFVTSDQKLLQKLAGKKLPVISVAKALASKDI